MRNKIKTDIITACYDRSLALLRKNTHSGGVIAAARTAKSVDRNYASIFGRDAAICSLGMVSSGDKELIGHAKKGLLTLARYQAPNGQIPKYVKPEKRESDYWYSGCIDATLWWLYAVDHFDRAIPASGLKKKLKPKIAKALSWLYCQEHQGMYLVQQNEASDWADIMPRSGFVLYSNALWYAVKKQYGIRTATKTRHFFRHIFFPFDKSCSEHRRAKILTEYVMSGAKQRDFYLSFVNFSFWGEDVDVYGNILACLFGIPTREKRELIVDRLLSRRANQPWPIRTLLSPIRRESCFWRLYMERHKQNLPYQYHNGGTWPYVAGFWILLLLKLGRKDLAIKELERYAKVCKMNNWEFNEWMHGKTGKPMGMAGQSWNAAMFIAAVEALKKHSAIREREQKIFLDTENTDRTFDTDNSGF